MGESAVAPVILPPLGDAPLPADEHADGLAPINHCTSIREDATTLPLAARSKRKRQQDIFAGLAIPHGTGTPP
jgi:hypothetical protein